MYCANCGKEVKDGVKFCPFCGSMFSKNADTPIDGDNYRNSNMYKSNSKKTMKHHKLFIALIGIAIFTLFIIVCIALGTNTISSDENSKIQLVQEGTLLVAEDIPIKAVVENYWNKGKWSNFDGEKETGEKANIVEYRKDDNNFIQFAVKDESFSIVHWEDNTNRIDDDELMSIDENYMDGEREGLVTCINTLYTKYAEDKLSMKDVDLCQYVNGTPEDMLKCSDTLVKSDIGISDKIHQIVMSCEEDAFDMISISGNKNYSPTFAGVAIGDTEYEEKFAKEDYLPVEGSDGVTYYLNENTGAGLMVEIENDKRIKGIIWVSTLSDYAEWTKDEEKSMESTDTTVETSKPQDDYIIPESSTRLLISEDYTNKSDVSLRYAKNEIYARHGRMFKDQELQDYFNKQSWYQGTIAPDDFTENMLSDIERQNVQILENAMTSTGEAAENKVYDDMNGVYILNLENGLYNEIDIELYYDSSVEEVSVGEAVAHCNFIYYLETKTDLYKGYLVKTGDNTYDLYGEVYGDYLGTLSFVNQHTIEYYGSQYERTNGTYYFSDQLPTFDFD